MSGPPTLEEKAAPAAEPRIKKLAKMLGPGIIAVLSWLGAGDLITSSVAGASYGYAMMWRAGDILAAQVSDRQHHRPFSAV